MLRREGVRKGLKRQKGSPPSLPPLHLNMSMQSLCSSFYLVLLFPASASAVDTYSGGEHWFHTTTQHGPIYLLLEELVTVLQ